MYTTRLYYTRSSTNLKKGFFIFFNIIFGLVRTALCGRKRCENPSILLSVYLRSRWNCVLIVDATLDDTTLHDASTTRLLLHHYIIIHTVIQPNIWRQFLSRHNDVSTHSKPLKFDGFILILLCSALKRKSCYCVSKTQWRVKLWSPGGVTYLLILNKFTNLFIFFKTTLFPKLNFLKILIIEKAGKFLVDSCAVVQWFLMES